MAPAPAKPLNDPYVDYGAEQEALGDGGWHIQ